MNWWAASRVRTNGCDYKEKDRRLKEQFINGITDDDTMTEIKKRATEIKMTN